MGPDRQSYTEYITCICEATFLQCFAKQQRQRGCGIANVLLVQLGDLGERCKLHQWFRAEPGVERYLLHFGLKRLLMRAISRAYSRKNTLKFDKLRDLVYVHSKPTFTGEHPLYVAPTRKQLVTDTTRH